MRNTDLTAQDLLDKLSELYSSRPTDECYAIFADGAGASSVREALR